MELNVKSDNIRSERKARVWSQEHLAHVSGIGVRTVQRIESSGVASYGTVEALVFALNISAQLLMNQLTSSDSMHLWKQNRALLYI
jgi:transcriptional regulator with XRE-family HTH domain